MLLELVLSEHNITLVTAAGWAANAIVRIDKYYWKMQQILVHFLALPNLKIGGAHQAAVAPQPMHVWEFRFLKSCSIYPHYCNICSLAWVAGHFEGSGSPRSKIILF